MPRNKNTGKKSKQALLKFLADDFRVIQMVIYNDLIIEKAQKIIVDHIVKTLDAIHLASAKALNLDVTFVSCDNQQLHIAKKLGLHTINPIPN